MSIATTTFGSYGHIARVIERAIGSNDAYPTPMQLEAHRAKQALKEKQFGNIDTKEESQ